MCHTHAILKHIFTSPWDYKKLSWVGGWDRKIHLRITIWHLSMFGIYPIHTRMDYISCSPFNTTFSYLKKVPRSSWIRWDATITSPCGCSIFIFPTCWFGICEIELSHMGKTGEIPIWCARKPSEWQTVWIQIRSNILSGLNSSFYVFHIDFWQ